MNNIFDLFSKYAFKYWQDSYKILATMSQNDIKEVFDMTTKLYSDIKAYKVLYHISNQQCYSANQFYTFVFRFYNNILEQLNDLRKICISMRLKYIHIYINKLSPVYQSYNCFMTAYQDDVTTFPDIYYDNIVLYKFSDNKDIEKYFNELIDDKIIDEIKDTHEKLKSYKVDVERVISEYKFRDKYSDLEFAFDDIRLSIRFKYEVPNYLKKFVHKISPKILLCRDTTKEKLTEICDQFTSNTHINILINGYCFINCLTKVLEELDFKNKVFYPKFTRDDKVNFAQGRIGLTKTSPLLYKQLKRAFLKIRSSVGIQDYPVTQCIIHSHAYVIEYSKRIIYEEKEYKIFMMRYFDTPFIVVTDMQGIRVSVNKRRKILKDWREYKQLVAEVNDKVSTNNCINIEVIKFIQTISNK